MNNKDYVDMKLKQLDRTIAEYREFKKTLPIMTDLWGKPMPESPEPDFEKMRKRIIDRYTT
jgi:hypothetical protein